MSVIIELMNDSGINPVPGASEFQRWGDAVLAALDSAESNLEIGIRLVNEAESAELNRHYRHKQGPTNVLSFSYTDIPEQAGSKLLGDLAICTQVVQREAIEQAKSLQAHWAHMTVHGFLHLLGYDHQEETAAEQMESLEAAILGNLGYANPYDIQVTDAAERKTH
jgi:probable rRNA maturation factor